MSLHAALTRAKTEEDVKDVYIEALGLKGVNKGLVDIQTPEIWFEAKEALRYMAGMMFSPEAQAVLNEGRKLFQRFHASSFPNKIRQEWKLGRPDAGWYQVRRALEAFSDAEFTDFDPIRGAYADLSAKLRPQVFELGFLSS